MVEESGLLDANDVGPTPTAGGVSFEERLNEFAELAKAATQLAGRLRTNLNTVSQNAQIGKVGNVASSIQKLSGGIAELSAHVDRLGEVERSLGLRGPSVNPADFVRELETELAKRGVSVTKGPDPYWLVYPAWFKVDRNAKGEVEVVLNGERVESLRPSEVASRIAEVVNEKFQAKKFADVLMSVRGLFRRAGANNPTLTLDDVYEVLAMGAGTGARQKEMTKGAFYYSVHRLAEQYEQAPVAAMEFPPANRSEHMFFSKDAHMRKYLTVEFTGAGSR